MREFEFNTGVRLQSGLSLSGEYQRWRDGVKIILFYADVPDNAVFMFASDDANIPEYNQPDIIVANIHGGLLSKFGYFRIPSHDC